MFRRILVGFDGSDEASHALRTALELAACVHGEVITMSVLRSHPQVESDDDRVRESSAERMNMTRGLEHYKKQSEERGITLGSVVEVSAEPARALVAYAQEHGFDLLVVGRHGREHAWHFGKGHALDRLLSAECPLLVV
jgi:nucleotide-binding universal stress UspA family protein